MNPRLHALALIVAAFPAIAFINVARAPGISITAAASQQMTLRLADRPNGITHGRLPTAAPDHSIAAYRASTPLASSSIATLPHRTPTPPPRAPNPSMSSPAPVRSGCDPAYPDVETCIPPGPPFAQGCSITTQRLFTVLPADPQRLDHDNDGIGCEPIAN